MRELPTVLLESFRRNGRVNAAVLERLTPEDLALDDGRGGWSVGQHLGHLVDFRVGWLTRVSPPHAEGLPELLDGTEERFWLNTTDRARIREAFDQGDAAALAAVQTAYAEDRAFPHAYTSDPAHFLQHILVHDAHHRGQVMSLLRQGGRTTDQMDELETATWPIWRE